MRPRISIKFKIFQLKRKKRKLKTKVKRKRRRKSKRKSKNSLNSHKLLKLLLLLNKKTNSLKPKTWTKLTRSNKNNTVRRRLRPKRRATYNRKRDIKIKNND